MSDIATKLTYLNETKSQLKDMINYGLPTENQITNETTFRNYVKGIFEAFLESLRDSTTLYTNLPKISGNGSQITLNDTAYAPMRITLGSSALEQWNLPSEYTQVDYIESSGTQYINTGYTPQIGDQFEFKNVSSEYDGALFSAGTGDYQFILIKFGAWFYKYFSTGNAMSVNKTIYNANIKINSSGHLYLNEEWLGVVSPVSAVNTSLHLFERANGQAKTIAKMGEIIISNSNNVIQRHYIPCYRNRDNVVGYYEKINGTFLTTEVGSFTYGAVATPTPSSPQDIHTISGSNNIVVEGKNIAYTGWASDFVNRINDSTKAKLETYDGKNCLAFYPSTGSGDYEHKYMFKPIGGFKENTQYTFKIDEYSTTSFGDMDIVYTDDSVTEIARQTLTANSWNSIVQTSSANKTIKYLKARWRGNDFQYIDLDTFMVYEGTTDTTYESYVSQTTPINLDTIEYCKIGNYEDEFILTSGKNLFDKDSATSQVGYFSSDGTINNGGSSTIITSYTPITPNTQYKLSGGTIENVCYYDQNKAFIKRVTSSASDINENAYYIRFQITTSTFDINKIQLEKGTTATSYEPYGTNQWYLKKNIGKIVLDGSESWVLKNTSGTWKYYQYQPTLGQQTTNGKLFLCNYFIATNTWGQQAVGMWFDTNMIVKTEGSLAGTETLETFTTWLSTHNTTVYYVLATPTYTQITGTLETQLNNIYKNMLSYKGTTNVSQINNDLPFVINASAIEDLS